MPDPIPCRGRTGADRHLRSGLRWGAWLGGFLALGCLAMLAGAAPITYDPSNGRLSASIEAVPLSRVLALVARTTGWEIRREPGPDLPITTGFTSRPAREALDRLLGGLDFSLTVRSNGPTRLLVYRTGADRATESVGADDDSRIANHLVVRLKDGSDMDPAQLAKELGARLLGSLPELGAHLLEFPTPEDADAARNRLAGRDGVSAVEDNHRIDTPDLPGAGTGSGQATLRIRPGSIDAANRLVAVVDTAIQPLGSAYDGFVVDRLSVRPGMPEAAEPLHGTTMLARLLTAAEAALPPGENAGFRVLGVNVYGDQSQTSSFDVARGIALAVERGAGIVNLSLGGPTPSPVLYDVIRQATQRGVLVVSAAGNVPSYDPTFPAGFPEVLAVTSGLPDGSFAPYANRSPSVDLILRGTGLVPFGGETWRVAGTSVAAAHASGVAVGLWLREGGTPAALRPLLERTYGLPAPGGR